MYMDVDVLSLMHPPYPVFVALPSAKCLLRLASSFSIRVTIEVSSGVDASGWLTRGIGNAFGGLSVNGRVILSLRSRLRPPSLPLPQPRRGVL